MVQSSESEGTLRHCVNCGNVVSLMFVEEEGSDDVWCITCWDKRMDEEKEDEE